MKRKKNFEYGSRTQSGSIALKVGSVLLVTVSLAACNAHRDKDVKGWLVADPTARHPILVGATPVVLDLPVAKGSYGLAQNQGYELRHFLRRYRHKNEGPITVAAPSGGSNEIAVMHALGEVKRELRRAGISRHEVHFAAYSATGSASSPIKISYNEFTARGPECGDWTDNLARDPKNIPYRNFGCATQRNLAAMVSNPRDFVEHRGMTPRDSQRRDVIMDKYVKGDTTVAQKSNEEKAKVSEISGGGEN